MSSQSAGADWFESSRSDLGWEFRPLQRANRRQAYFHSGCLTLFAAVILVPLLSALIGGGIALIARGIAFLLAARLTNQWEMIFVVIGCGLGLIGSIPLLRSVAGHIFRKSIRDNWLTLNVTTGGAVTLGEKLLVQAGRARGVVVRTETRSDSEGSSTYHFVEVVLAREGAAPVAIPVPEPIFGNWEVEPGNEMRSREFAQALALALGVNGPDSPM